MMRQMKKMRTLDVTLKRSKSEAKNIIIIGCEKLSLSKYIVCIVSALCLIKSFIFSA